MSSSNRPVDGSAEHRGGTSSAGRNGTATPARTSTAPPVDAVATPIYDELAARFDLLPGREGAERRADTPPVDTTRSDAAEADEEPVAMRQAS
ncbi:hypothetical protein ACQPYE_28110 [Actinosynnema sp. CA-299493]